MTEQFSDQFYADGVSHATLDAIEVMVHPADLDDRLSSVTSYFEPRLLEKQVLVDYERPQLVGMTKAGSLSRGPAFS